MISNVIIFYEPLETVLINMITILMISAKMATIDVLKIKVLWIKGFEVMIFVHDISNKILLHDSNYIVDVVIWPKFGNCNISMRKVILISILLGLD